MAVVTKVLDRTLAVLTQGTQSWAEAASITLTEDGEWLILCSFELGIDSQSINVEVRLQQDNTTELQYGRFENMQPTASYKSWFWMTRVTRSGSDVLLDLDFEPLNTATARIRNRILMALKLDDMGTEDTDWRWQAVDTLVSDVDDIWENVDGVLLTETWTPGTEEDWLIIACCELTANSTNRNADVRLSLNDEASVYDMSSEEGEDTIEWRWWTSIRLLTLPTSSQKFEIQVRTDVGATADARRARFFAIRKAVFDQVVEFRADTYTGPAFADTWDEKLNAYFTPNQQEDVLILGHCGIDYGATALLGITRVHEEETDELMHNDNTTADATDLRPCSFADIKNWTASLKDADLDIKATQTSVLFGDACVIFVSLTLAEVGAIVKIMTETVGLTEAALRRASSIRLMTETVGLSEAFVRRMWSVRQMAETVSIQETLLRRGRQVRLMTETISISDTMLRIFGFVKLMAETVGISETMSRVAGFVKVMTTEILGISEGVVVRRMWSVRQMVETVSLSEGVLRRMWSVRQMASTVGIPDSVLRRARSVRQMASTIDISDSLLRRARSVRLMAEAVSISETLVRAMILIKTMTSTVNISDAEIRRMWTVRLMSSTVGITETLLRRARMVRIISEVMGILDSWLKKIGEFLGWDEVELESRIHPIVEFDSPIAPEIDEDSDIAPEIDLRSKIR